MLNEHTLDQLRSLRLDGMVRAIEEQAMSTAVGREEGAQATQAAEAEARLGGGVNGCVHGKVT